jgi:hypothetical protein
VPCRKGDNEIDVELQVGEQVFEAVMKQVGSHCTRHNSLMECRHVKQAHYSSLGSGVVVCDVAVTGKEVEMAGSLAGYDVKAIALCSLTLCVRQLARYWYVFDGHQTRNPMS